MSSNAVMFQHGSSTSLGTLQNRAGRLACVSLLVAVAGLALFFGATLLLAAETELPDFRAVIKEHGDSLSTVNSNEQAIRLFTAHLAAALHLRESMAALTASAQLKRDSGKDAAREARVIPNPDEAASRLTAELAAWRLATAIRQAAEAGSPEGLRTLLNQIERQQGWLLQENDRRHLHRAVALAGAISSLTSHYAEPETPRGYELYAAYLDHAYPQLVDTDESWLAVAEREGAEGLQRRLLRIWTEPNGIPGEALKLLEGEKDRLAARYVKLRLQPVLIAQLIASAIRAEAEAEQQTRAAWMALRAWQERAREERGLARLCGTWQWTIHNHQNHQDHKVIMSFPPPDAPASAGLRPAKVVVLGDSVYLRWEFQGGYQEDSLLFGRDGQRLEGTFINSAGAWGSITGKRVAACQR